MAHETKATGFHANGDGEPDEARSSLVTIQPGAGAQAALFCVHAEAGDVSLYEGLARHLASEQRVFGLCAPSAAEFEALDSLEQLAARHVREIRAVQADGPYLIVGECTGGALAYEMAQQLRAADQEVALLALIDAFPTGAPPLASHMPKPAYRILHRARILGFHVGNLLRLGLAEKLAYLRSKGARARAALKAKVARLFGDTPVSASQQLAFRRALAAYEAKPYAGSAVVFRARRLSLGIEASQSSRDLGWGRLVEDVQVEMLPGYFTTPISEPGVRVLADRLSQRLRDCAQAA